MKCSVRFHFVPRAFVVAAWLLLILRAGSFGASTDSDIYLSPTALVVSKDGMRMFVACAGANCVMRIDPGGRRIVGSLAMPGPPLGMAVSADDSRLYVVCVAPESKVCIVNAEKLRIVGMIPAGHTAMAPVLSPDGKTLYVCNRFNNDVSVLDLARMKEVRRIPVQREPVAAAGTKDGKFLLVANHLHSGRADWAYVAAVVSVVDLAAGKVVKEIQLPNGSGGLKDIRVSPDGRHAVVTHVVGRFNRPTTQLYYGWMNVNAMTVIDLARMEIQNTVLLDDRERGAANPWGLAWTADGTLLVVAHAGMHEISIIDFPLLVAHLPRLPVTSDPAMGADSTAASRSRAALADNLPFLTGSRTRVKLPEGDLGPRAVAVLGHTAYVANYFSDTLTVINLDAPKSEAESIPLGPKQEMSAVRKGEFYFHDASICLQGWQSCSSCHPGNARADGLNWDLLNDGIGNAKNTKSLLLAHRTPPAMSLGVRDNAETAVRAGIKHILFSQQSESVAAAIDEYLKSLKPVPSPYLVHGKFSPAAARGKRIFVRAGCASCHPPGLFTDKHSYDVGTSTLLDLAGRKVNAPSDSAQVAEAHKAANSATCASCHNSQLPVDLLSSKGGASGLTNTSTLKFDTPTLIEVWRTSPYLHDGSASTIRNVVTTHNPHDQHGKTSNLTSQEIDDLCAYVLSL